jgi:thiol:disulfide interchange protein DsbD
MLIGVAVYFLIPQVERIYDKLGFLLGIVTVFTGLLLGFLDQTLMYSKKFKISRSIFGILVIILGGIWINGSIHATKSDITWIYLTEQPIEQVIDPEKPTFIDFYADWCAPCKQLDRTTFSDPRVAEKSKKLNMVKVDCTTPNKQIQNTMNKYNVTGMPTLVFLDRSMNEKSSMREIGYIDADTFLNKMDTLLEKK